MLTGLGAGLGFLMKGPLGVIVPAIVLGPIWWRERRTLNVRPAHLAVAAGVFAVSGLPWYIAMTRDARLGVCEQLLRRRQPRALRDDAIQRSA